ncbi:cation transporter [Massilia sp. YMA4]|nr:cation transporter [Massilia sp. YMA4]
MDCPSEENLIRMALGKRDDITALTFDLGARTVTVEHSGDGNGLVDALGPLGLGAQLQESHPLPTDAADKPELVETVISVPKMDCPSEENMIRMALADSAGIQALTFDLGARTLRVVHQGDVDAITNQLTPLGLGARVVSSTATTGSALPPPDAAGDAAEARTLRLLLAINGLMFLVEMAWGIIAQSTGLIADSLDMFADAAVYGLALYAVGRAASLKARAAHLAGWLQLVLALGALSEVIRRAFVGSEPESAMMMGVGALALVANVACLILIAKKRDRGAHMKASYIFSANDVIANLGVIIAGVLVTWTGSSYPDLIVGTIIAVIVLIGARRILALR